MDLYFIANSNFTKQFPVFKVDTSSHVLQSISKLHEAYILDFVHGRGKINCVKKSTTPFKHFGNFH